MPHAHLGSMSGLQSAVQQALPLIDNRPEIFGRQFIMDENDDITGEEPRMLLTATRLTLDEVVRLAGSGRCAIPAHTDRSSYSILSNLGFVPEELDIRYLEISRDCDEARFRAMHPELDIYRSIRSSDAHYLGDILERESMLELDELSAEAIIRKLTT